MNDIEQLIRRAAIEGARELLDRSPSEKRLYNAEEAARYLGLTPKALEAMRMRGDGPSVTRYGRRVLYDVNDLRAWAERLRRSER